MVIRVYSAHLTIAGEASLRSVAHLERLPKTLTSAARHQDRAVLAGRGVYESGVFRGAWEREARNPESSHLKIFADFFRGGLAQKEGARGDG